MNIDRNSWHYKLLRDAKYDGKECRMPTSLCSYINAFFNLFLLSMIVLLLSFLCIWVVGVTGWALIKYPIMSLIDGVSLYEVFKGNYSNGSLQDGMLSVYAFLLMFFFLIVCFAYSAVMILKWMWELFVYVISIPRMQSRKEGSFLNVVASYYDSIKEGICPDITYVGGDTQNGDKHQRKKR